MQRLSLHLDLWFHSWKFCGIPFADPEHFFFFKIYTWIFTSPGCRCKWCRALSNLHCSLLVYSTAMDFCVLNLFSATLLWFRMHSGCFLFFDLLMWFSYADSRLTCEKRIVLFLPSQSASFTSWLIRSSWIPRTKLNRSDERQQHCLVSGLKGKASGFSQLSVMLVVHFLVNNLDQVEKIPLCSQFVENFNHELVLCFVKCFSASVDQVLYFFLSL